MGDSLWNQVWLPLLIGVASSIVFAALCFLSIRLWNCFIKQLTPQTAVGERDHDQPRPVSDADDANALPDLEMGTVNGGEGGESKALADLDVGMANGGEGEVRRRAAACGSGRGANGHLKFETRRKPPCLARHLDSARIWLGTFDTAAEAAMAGAGAGAGAARKYEFQHARGRASSSSAIASEETEKYCSILHPYAFISLSRACTL